MSGATVHPAPQAPSANPGGWGLGLDAGGTHTRWALADAAGQVRASGELPSMSGQQLASDDGRQTLAHTLQALNSAVAAALRAAGRAEPMGTTPAAILRPQQLHAVVAGITGFDAQAMPQWRALAASALQIPANAVRACSDIELACAAAFAPGRGVVLIAGTGSIAAHVDAQGQLHRAGGRGAVIDDAGGGHWIARQALLHIWRAEDAAPGAWQASPLARAVLAHIGGDGLPLSPTHATAQTAQAAGAKASARAWATTRAWVYGATRGELGTLAQAVAQVADADAAAAAILQQAGAELARLVLALQQRLGAQPVALTGRVWDLHPMLQRSLQQHLPADGDVQHLRTPAHHAAARLAATMQR